MKLSAYSHGDAVVNQCNSFWTKAQLYHGPYLIPLTNVSECSTAPPLRSHYRYSNALSDSAMWTAN